VSNLAKVSMVEKDYELLMAKINSQNLNGARLFVEDKIDEIIFSRKIESFNYNKLKTLKQLDTIITNEYINRIDVNGAKTISQ